MDALLWAFLLGLFVGVSTGLFAAGLCQMASRRSTLLKYDRHVAGQGASERGKGW